MLYDMSCICSSIIFLGLVSVISRSSVGDTVGTLGTIPRAVSGVGYVLFCLFSGDGPVMVALKCLFFPLIHKKKKGKNHFGITSSLRSHPFCIAVLSIAGYK